VARGKHVVDAVVGCSAAGCHGPDLGGGKPLAMGPLGEFDAPNITPSGVQAAYSDGELGRLIRHGVKKDGRSLRMMPAQDFCWLSDSDLAAVVSYLRTVPAVDRPNGVVKVGLLGKVLDRRGAFSLDIARRIDHEKPDLAPPPSPTPAYGKYLAHMCTGCHGEHLSGGPIPGAPSNLPTPLNLTPDPSGLAGWTYEDFDALLTKGVRKNGKKLDPFMPIESFGRMDETEKKALFAELQALPPTPFGNR
jgi:mono/diheme cytochrome c family protein